MRKLPVFEAQGVIYNAGFLSILRLHYVILSRSGAFRSYAAVIGAYLLEASILSITASGEIFPPMTISNTAGE